MPRHAALFWYCNNMVFSSLCLCASICSSHRKSYIRPNPIQALSPNQLGFGPTTPTRVCMGQAESGFPPTRHPNRLNWVGEINTRVQTVSSEEPNKSALFRFQSGCDRILGSNKNKQNTKSYLELWINKQNINHIQILG